MAKSKDPAFLFYPSDFILGTYTMSDEQVGKYIRLLCLQFSKGGKLTYDDILKVLDKDENELGRKDREILEKFKIDEEGLYYNQRLLDEIKDREERSLINKQNGSKGGNPNFTKGKSNIYYQTNKQLDNQKDNQTVILSDNQIDKPIDNQKINIALKDENKDIIKDFDLKEEVKKKDKRFVIPNIEDIKEYCNSRNNGIDANMFYDFYTSKGWKVGKEPMKDWKASVRTWERSRKENNIQEEKEEYHVKTTRI